LWLALLPAVSASAQPASQLAFRVVLEKYDALADAERDLDRLRALEVERGRELVAVLGAGLRFDGWQLVLTAAEPTPLGALFLRLHDPGLEGPRSVRPTYWNSGPGALLRETEITRHSPLYAPIGFIRRGRMVVVSGIFFPDAKGGVFYESARISGQELNVERARFRMPYFSIRIDAIDEPSPDRRYP
jgi:hypothetical protein